MKSRYLLSFDFKVTVPSGASYGTTIDTFWSCKGDYPTSEEYLAAKDATFAELRKIYRNFSGVSYVVSIHQLEL